MKYVCTSENSIASLLEVCRHSASTDNIHQCGGQATRREDCKYEMFHTGKEIHASETLN